MIRKIIHIDEEKCNGCGLCANACHEGAIDLVNGKAKLVREHFCDGFGDCLPACPAGAISFEEREAPAYDEAAVKASRKATEGHNITENHNIREDHNITENRALGEKRTMAVNEETPDQEMPEVEERHVCPGSRSMVLKHQEESAEEHIQKEKSIKSVSRLNQWPCQIKLLPEEAPFYNGAKLLIAADCTAYAYANMHEDFMKGKVTLIGCPKLDAVDYSEKLTSIIAKNDIKSVTILRMEVPCCGGLQRAAEMALRNSGKFIPWQVVTISRDGRIVDV